MAQTSRFIRPLIEFLFPSASPETILMIHAAVRKSAHFVEYAVLAILAARAFGRSASNVSGAKGVLWILITVIAVAVVDEFIQSFNAARTGSPYDVLLDLAGGVAGLLLFAAFGRFRTRRADTR